jgi:hypothetical protein
MTERDRRRDAEGRQQVQVDVGRKRDERQQDAPANRSELSAGRGSPRNRHPHGDMPNGRHLSSLADPRHATLEAQAWA